MNKILKIIVIIACFLGAIVIGALILPNLIKIYKMNSYYASDAVSQALFSGFAVDIGNLQDHVDVAMFSANDNEIAKENNRSEAQLYNFVARGGYTAISEENWLSPEEAEEIPCTMIDKLYAEESLGTALPVIKVETAKNANQEVSFFVTPKGEVFCWPPYLYDGKSYVTSNTRVLDENANELVDLQATEKDKVYISFRNTEEVIIVKNNKETEFEKGTISDIAGIEK